MSISAYIDDIGVTYLCIPIITWGLGAAISRFKSEINSTDNNEKI